MDNLVNYLDEIFLKKENKKFFVFPFLEILCENYKQNEFIWMNKKFKKDFSNNLKDIKTNAKTIEEYYIEIYGDDFSKHGNKFNSSHAISHKITGDLKWLQEYVDFKSFNNNKETENKGKGSKKPLYKIKESKLNEIKKLINQKEKYLDSVYSLIYLHIADKTNVEWKKREKEFKSWAYKTVKNNSSIDNYINSTLNNKLPDELKRLKEKDKTFISIFQETDIKYLKNIYESLIKGNLKSFNYSVNKQEPSASIKKYIQYLTEIFNKKTIFGEINMLSEKKENQPLNQILYGPPGTGKTYTTINKALKIIFAKENKEKNFEIIKDDTKYEITYQNALENNNREALTSIFEFYKEKGQIEFVTFHQSYGYEEFVEGIKADTNEKEVIYKKEDGIFKKLCSKAKEIVYTLDDDLKFSLDNSIWKVSLNGSGDNEIKKECYEKGYIRFSYEEKFPDNLENHENLNTPLEALNNKMKIGDVVVSLDTNKTINQIGVIESDYEYLEDSKSFKHARKVKWLFSKGTDPIDFFEINNNTVFANSAIHRIYPDKDKFLELLPNQNVESNNSDKKFILIIDEINRGNISKIFGELITLIEPSKRVGADEEIRLRLPYSGNTEEPFGVPSNLHILGTMNTADRSIALMDTALRRRFDFEEMMPKPEFLEKIDIDGIDIKLLLETINQRIEYLYDRDHTIGHAYFMSLKDKNTLTELENIFKNKIIPLLQEYFYDDCEKIRLVLGDNQKTSDNEKYQFIKIKKGYDITNLFGSNTGEIEIEDDQKVFEINNEAFQYKESYIRTYEKK